MTYNGGWVGEAVSKPPKKQKASPNPGLASFILIVNCKTYSDSSFFDYYVQFFTGKPLPSLPAPNHSAKMLLNEAYDKLSFHDKTILVKIADAMSK